MIIKIPLLPSSSQRQKQAPNLPSITLAHNVHMLDGELACLSLISLPLSPFRLQNSRPKNVNLRERLQLNKDFSTPTLTPYFGV